MTMKLRDIILGALILSALSGFVSQQTQIPSAKLKKTPTLEQIVDTSVKKELRNFKGYEDPMYHKHDEHILEVAEKLNKKFENFPGYDQSNPMLIKSMIIQESGSNNHREAFMHDPMQIANQGDYGLDVLQESDIYTRLGIEDISKDFRRFAHSQRVNGSWDYSGNHLVENEKRLEIMDVEHSILGGTIFLAYKKFKYGSNGKPIASRTWKEAVKRYNGTEEYANAVFSRLDQ